MAVSRWRPLWLVCSFGLAVGANHWTKPRVPYVLSAGERTMATGSLWLEDKGERVAFPLVTIHVVATAVRRAFADPLVVRALWIRSPESDGQSAPDLELFVDFNAPDGRVIDAHARDPNELRQRDLPVLPAAIGGAARSHIRFAGSEDPAFVSEGRLFIRQALNTEVAASWRIEGDLDLLVQQHGAERHLKGMLAARLVWD
jgi:hypothetical protein